MHKNATDTNKSIITVPSGVWESSRPAKAHEAVSSETTDSQGNGYPPNKNKTEESQKQ